MSIPFVIRDDDLCFFTKATEIESFYGDIWQEFPITFAAIPWQKGTLAGHIPVTHWHSSQSFPLGDNHDLVALVGGAVKKGFADIALHGINHVYDVRGERFIPELVDFKGDFIVKLRAAKEYLDGLFDLDVKVFVPPSNTMSVNVAKILISEGWDLLNLPGIRHNTRSITSMRHQFARVLRLWSFIFHGVDLVTPIVFRNRWEIGGFPLTPKTDLELLKKAFLRALEQNVPFVLATHYWQHLSFVTGSRNVKQFDLFMQFIDFVRKYSVLPMRASAITFHRN